MENEKIKIRYNVIEIRSLEAFSSVRGGFVRECKDVSFVRMIGVSPNYQKDIEQMDCVLTGRMNNGQGKYMRLNGLPKLMNGDDIIYYSGCYEEWSHRNCSRCSIKSSQGQNELEELLGQACGNICGIFQRITKNTSDSMVKNFMAKLLFWTDAIGESLLKDWTIRSSYKVVLSGILKKQEYLFCYFLTMLGMDVMLLLPEQDVEDIPEINKSVGKMILGDTCVATIPVYDRNKPEKPAERPTQQPVQQSPESPARQPVRQMGNLPGNPPGNPPVAERPRISLQDVRRERVHNQNTDNARRKELEFEELALLASSVVMIAVRDSKGEVIGTGSGIMIGKAGYILTNSHVACGGAFYSVRIEDDQQTYDTDEVIKYNQVLDLAIIRIDRTLKPLPVYNGKKELVRGQKVVAIGSPLGLFNSVSDGIISGFRKINDVDMIQFTAPISHGSSGGAVFNMYGEIIGISTAGIDDGQNINLAVGYQNINNFIRGFT